MTELTHVMTNTDLDETLTILDRDGCVVIDNALDQKRLSKLRNELAPHFAETPNCHGDFYGYVTKRLSSLIGKSSSCQQMAIEPTILSIMDKVLLKSCSQYQLNLTQGIQIGPGEPQQIVHRDDLMFPFPHTGHEWMINCMWAMDDFTAENGATHVVPGSHKWAPDRQPEEHEIIQAEMEAGSVLIYYASLLHGGGANRSNSPRAGIVLSYCLGWLRQAENQYLAIPPQIAKTLPHRLQRLLGYFVHEPNLGCVEGQDPIQLLQGESLANKRFEEFLPEEAKQMLKEHLAGKREAA